MTFCLIAGPKQGHEAAMDQTLDTMSQDNSFLLWVDFLKHLSQRQTREVIIQARLQTTSFFQLIKRKSAFCHWKLVETEQALRRSGLTRYHITLCPCLIAHDHTKQQRVVNAVLWGWERKTFLVLVARLPGGVQIEFSFVLRKQPQKKKWDLRIKLHYVMTSASLWCSMKLSPEACALTLGISWLPGL